MELLHTSRDKRHRHLVVTDSERLSGSTTKAGGARSAHQHVVIVDPVVSAFVTLPAADGHVHTLIPLQRTAQTTEVLNDHDKVREVKALYAAAREHDRMLFKLGKESFDFVANKMWTDEELLELKDAERAPSVINEIEPKIDLLCGYQRQNRYDIKYFPVEEGDVLVADILTALIKGDTARNLYDHKESAVFEDGVICGRGLFQMRVDRSEHVEGRIKIERYPWDGASIGPHNEPDLSDAEYQVKWKTYSRAKLKQLWPKRAARVEATFLRLQQPKEQATPSPSLELGDTDQDPHTQTKPDQYESGALVPADLDREWPEFVNIAKKEILVVELQKKVFARVPVIYNAGADFYLNAEGVPDAELAAVPRDLPGFQLQSRLVTRFHITIVAHDVVLEDGQAPDEVDDLSLIPFYAKKHGTRVWGKVEAAKYPNKEINKLHSKYLDIIDKAGGYGWFSVPTTFANEREKQRFDEERNKAGFHVQVTSMDKVPTKVEGVRFPVEITQGLQLTSDKLKEIMNIMPELLGLNSKAESGVAINAKKQQGLIGNEFLFDNLRLTKWMIGARYAKMVPHVYTPQRIIRAIANIHQQAPVRVSGMDRPEFAGLSPMDETSGQPTVPQSWGDLTPAHLEAIERLLTDHDYTQYDVLVGESTANPTTRIANFQLAIELIKAFPMIGQVTLDLVINMSDFPEKQEWVQRIQQVMAQGTPTPSSPNGTPASAPRAGTAATA